MTGDKLRDTIYTILGEMVLFVSLNLLVRHQLLLIKKEPPAERQVVQTYLFNQPTIVAYSRFQLVIWNNEYLIVESDLETRL